MKAEEDIDCRISLECTTSAAGVGELSTAAEAGLTHLASQAVYGSFASLQSLIGLVKVSCKVGIGLRVLVPTANTSSCRDEEELLQRLPHLRSSALKKPPASQSKECVTCTHMSPMRGTLAEL